MATLSVLEFNDPYGAERVMIALQGMQERQLITLEDAAVVSWPQGNKKPITRQLHSTAGAGATWGAFWGFLFGLIFFVPFLGAAIGAGTGALSGSLADVGIDDDGVQPFRAHPADDAPFTNRVPRVHGPKRFAQRSIDDHHRARLATIVLKTTHRSGHAFRVVIDDAVSRICE